MPESQRTRDRGLRMPATWLGLLVGIVLSIGSETLYADLIVWIDFDPVANGIQSAKTVEQGQSLTANLVLAYNDVVGLDSYRFSVQFDNSGVSYTTAISTPLANFSATAGPPNITLPNIVGPFEAASDQLFNGPSSIAPTVVGSVTFMAGLTSGNFTIRPFEDPRFDGSFNNNAAPVPVVSFNAGTIRITAVPEPSSLILCLVLAVGMFNRDRRQ
jgi:hypothetical protein